MGHQFKDDDFQYCFELALACTYRGAADVGEVLATAARIADGDADAWLREWIATAGVAWSAAKAAVGAGRRVSALGHYRRAATYYAAAFCMITRSSEPERRGDLWRRRRECWERIVDLSPGPGERVAVPYERTALPAWFFRAPGAKPAERRPLVVVNNGSDRAASQMWVDGGAAAAERGWHWMTFDGPGQESMLFDRGIPARPDWEAVLTPVLDALLTRPSVDPGRIVLLGAGEAGYSVARALAFEHRFAAAAVDPGVVDVSVSWLDRLPEALRKDLEQGRRRRFDCDMHVADMFSRSTRRPLGCSGEPYGVGEDSPYALYEAVARYRLGEEVRQIDTPLLITETEDERLWPGQSKALHELLPGEKRLVRFSSADRAGRQYAPVGRSIRDAAIFDWFEERLTRDRGGR